MCTTRPGLRTAMRLALAAHMAVMNPNHSLIDAYTPRLPGGRWEQIAPLVRRVVRTYAPGRTVEATRLALGTLTYFADWVTTSGVAPVDASLIENIIDVYAEERLHEVSATMAQRERKLLRHLADLPARIERDRAVLTTSAPDSPYGPASLVAVERWAAGQRTELRRHSCHAIMALGLGCGLTAKSMGHVRGTDITALPTEGIAVHAHHPDRLIPVVHRWEEDLRAHAARAGDEYLISPGMQHRDKAANLTVGMSIGDVVPSMHRLRSTWIVAQLNNRTPLPALLTASGLTAVDSLKRYVPFADSTDTVVQRNALRLAEGAW